MGFPAADLFIREPLGENAAKIISTAAGVVLLPDNGNYQFVDDHVMLALFDNSWDDENPGWPSRLDVYARDADTRLNLLFDISDRLRELGHETLILSDEEVDIDEWAAANNKT